MTTSTLLFSFIFFLHTSRLLCTSGVLSPLVMIKLKGKKIHQHGPRPLPNLTHLSPSWPSSQFSLVSTSRIFKGFVQSQNRGIKIGTKGFASTSYTIADDFRYNRRATLVLKLQKTGFRKRWILFWCGVRCRKFRGTAHMRILLLPPPLQIFENFLFCCLSPPPVYGRSETTPVVTGAVAAGGVSASFLYLEVTSHYVLQRFWGFGSAIHNLTPPIATLQK